MLSRLLAGLTGKRMHPDIQGTRERLVLPDKRGVIYAIGDVHGCLDQLLKMEEAIVTDAARLPNRDRLIVVLGDFIDRGPRSAEVVDHLLGNPPAGFQRIVLAGNHETEMLAFLGDPVGSEEWLHIGGLATLASYGVPVGRIPMPSAGRRELALRASASIPEEHLEFLRRLPVAAQCGRYLFAHAGIRPGVSLQMQSDRDLLEIRRAFTASSVPHEFIVVHGHTPSLEPERLPNRIGVDVAVYATGRLAAARLDGPDADFLIVR